MKKYFLIIFICLIIFTIIVLVSCDKKTPSNDTNQENNTPNGTNNIIENPKDETENSIISTHSFYIDSTDISINNTSIKISCSESSVSYSSENKELKITLICKNTETNKKTFAPTNAQIKHETANVIYNVTTYALDSTILEYGIDNTFRFKVQIPESYKKTKYTLSFYNDETQSEKYTFFLYETPDELRKDCKVQFKIGNKTVNTTSIKERRLLTELYTWENPNHLAHCKEWYIDENFKTEFAANTPITTDITLYGMETNNIKTTKDASGKFIENVTYVPTDGILVIPFSPNDNKVSISNYAIYNNYQIKEIYLPENLKKIYYGNFIKMPNLKKIHYAGTQQEWELIENMSTIPTTTTIDFNSKFQ